MFIKIQTIQEVLEWFKFEMLIEFIGRACLKPFKRKPSDKNYQLYLYETSLTLKRFNQHWNG
jgi:hypothetical protein